jgi:anti-sigma factor RsiW
MKQLCESIDTLAMALYDGELAGEELRDLELHLTECASCREHTEREGAAISGIRRKLAPPPTPDLLRARVMRALDAEDKATRRPLSTWLLPGAAAVAAVAALALFISVRKPSPTTRVEDVVAQSTTRSRPLEVEGAATNQWVQRNFDPTVALPTFASARVDQWGARLYDVYDREAVQLYLRVTLPEGFTRDVQVTIFDAHGIQLGGRREEINGRALLVGVSRSGRSVVTYRDGRDRAYLFTSSQLAPDDLLELVGTSSLLMQVRDDERFR